MTMYKLSDYELREQIINSISALVVRYLDRLSSEQSNPIHSAELEKINKLRTIREMFETVITVVTTSSP